MKIRKGKKKKDGEKEVASLQAKGRFSFWEGWQAEFLNGYNYKWKKEQNMNSIANSSFFLLLFLPWSSYMDTAMMY